jgi:hypothetical protein
MADPRAFISFDFDHDETEKNLFVGQSKNSKSPFSIEDWSSKSSLPQPEWEELIKGLLRLQYHPNSMKWFYVEQAPSANCLMSLPHPHKRQK